MFFRNKNLNCNTSYQPDLLLSACLVRLTDLYRTLNIQIINSNENRSFVSEVRLPVGCNTFNTLNFLVLN